MENMPKVYKKHIWHESEGRRCTTGPNQGPNERRTSPYPKQITLTPCKTHMGQVTMIKGDNTAKTGAFGPSQGAAATMVHPYP